MPLPWGEGVSAAIILLGAYDTARIAAHSWEDPTVDLHSDSFGVDIASIDVCDRTTLHVAATVGMKTRAAQVELMRLLKRTVVEALGC